MQFSGEQMSQIGVGGIIALMLLREVFSFLKTRSTLQPEVWKTEIHDIHKWVNRHAVLDSKALEKVSETLETQTFLMKEMIFEMKETRKDVDSIRDRIKDKPICPV